MLHLNIRRRREVHRWTQGYVAAEIGVKQSFISKLENGLVAPRIIEVVRLARLFGCTLDELVHQGTDGRSFTLVVNTGLTNPLVTPQDRQRERPPLTTSDGERGNVLTRTWACVARNMVTRGPERGHLLPRT